MDHLRSAPMIFAALCSVALVGGQAFAQMPWWRQRGLMSAGSRQNVASAFRDDDAAVRNLLRPNRQLPRPDVRDPGTDFSDYPNSAEVVPVGVFYLTGEWNHDTLRRPRTTVNSAPKPGSASTGSSRIPREKTELTNVI